MGRSSGETATLVVTNLTKLAGLIVALFEVLGREEIRPGALAIAALMMAGAQSLDTFFKSFFGGKP